MKHRTHLAALTIGGALALAACSGGTNAATTTVAPTTPPTTAPVATTTPTTTISDGMMDTTTFAIEITNTSGGFAAREAQSFAVPVGASDPGPALPGDAYATTFAAAPGDRVSFATMFVQSNDWFFSFDPEGLALFADDGSPITGDVTDAVSVWDAGTEIDQDPGTGQDQPPRQTGPNTGAVDPDATVRAVDGEDAADYVTVELSNEGDDFTLTITNTSGDADTPTPLAPGVVVVHNAGTPLFEAGKADLGIGLEALAEDGDPAAITESLDAEAGVTTPLAPGVAVVLDQGTSLFIPGSPASDDGLEALAEDGDPSQFAANTGGTVFAVPTGATEPGPLLPGESYTVEVEAAPGESVSFATMFVQSNDWFFSLGDAGISLFEADGTPISGDVTDRVSLWDAGTEADQTPGIGADQPPRQAGPNSGDADPDDSIRLVDGFSAGDYVTVTITPQS